MIRGDAVETQRVRVVRSRAHRWQDWFVVGMISEVAQRASPLPSRRSGGKARDSEMGRTEVVRGSREWLLGG